MNRKKLNTKDLCMIGVFTAVIVIMAQIQIPMPFGVPFTMQTFALILTGLVLGSKKGTIAAVIYVLLGIIGVPVFAGFAGGFQIIASPVGGFILSFPLLTLAAGLAKEIRNNSKIFYILYLILGLILNYLCGIAIFCIITKASVLVGFTSCVLPFIIPDILKAILAVTLSTAFQKRLSFL